MDEEALAKVRARTNYYAAMVPAVPATFHRLQAFNPSTPTVQASARSYRHRADEPHGTTERDHP